LLDIVRVWWQWYRDRNGLDAWLIWTVELDLELWTKLAGDAEVRYR
jgi:hypothetical protein